MKVCFLINQLAPGGAPTLLLDIVRHTGDDEDIDYTVCFIEGDDSLAADFERCGARVVDFEADFKFDPRAMLRLAKFYHDERFDIVHTHLPYAQSLGRVASLLGDHGTVVSTQHDFPGRYRLPTRILEQASRPIDDASIAVSKDVEEAFTGESHLYPERPNSWCTIYNGVDVEGFTESVSSADGDSIRTQHDIGSNDPVILSVGRFTPPKAQKDLIRAIVDIRRTMPDVHLLLLGWGPLRDELQTTAREYGVSDCVTITGPTKNVEPYFAAADIFVLSSTSESFGIVLVEAMAAKLPVVATDIRGVREVVVDGETGVLVPPRSPEELADATIETLEHDAQLGQCGYHRAVETFDISRTVSSHLSLYRDLYNGG